MLVRFWQFVLEFDNVFLGIVLSCFAAHAWFSFYQDLSIFSLYYPIALDGLALMLLLTVLAYALSDTVTSVLLTLSPKPIAKCQSLWKNLLCLLAAFGATAFIWIPVGNLVQVNKCVCLSMISLGLVIAMVCLAYLRSAFSITPQARFLVTSGPYSVVRHPMYTSQIVSLLGLTLLNGSFPAVVLFIVCAGLQFARARLEERLLQGTFPEYSIYQRDVGGFIPKLGPVFS